MTSVKRLPSPAPLGYRPVFPGLSSGGNSPSRAAGSPAPMPAERPLWVRKPSTLADANNGPVIAPASTLPAPPIMGPLLRPDVMVRPSYGVKRPPGISAALQNGHIAYTPIEVPDHTMDSDSDMTDATVFETADEVTPARRS